MARRYVRDKGGRFASKGGGGKRTGKLSKSTAGRSAKAKYKSATSKVRKSERDFKSARKSSSVMSKKASRANWSEKATGKAMVAGDKFARAGRARTSAKGQLTRVTNKMTKKGAAKAKVSPRREKALAKSRALATERPRLKKSLASTKKAKATRAKTAAKKKAAATKKVEAKKATAAKKKVAAKKKTYGGLTPKQQYKAATSKARAAKSGYAQDRGQGYDRAGKAAGKGKVKRSLKLPGTDSARGIGSAKAQVTKLQKKFRKGTTQGKGYGLSKKGQKAKGKFKDLKRQRGGVTKGKGTIAQRKKSLNVRTTQQAFGMKVKKPVSKAAQKYIGKRNVEASRVSSSRGKGSKAKRRAKDLRDVKNLRNAAKASNTPKGAKKNYLDRANEIEGKYNKKRR